MKKTISLRVDDKTMERVQRYVDDVRASTGIEITVNEAMRTLIVHALDVQDVAGLFRKPERGAKS